MDSRQRQRGSVPVKSMCTSVRLNMSTVVEDCDEVNETIIAPELEQMKVTKQLMVKSAHMGQPTESREVSEHPPSVSQRSSDISSKPGDEEDLALDCTPIKRLGQFAAGSFGPAEIQDVLVAHFDSNDDSDSSLPPGRPPPMELQRMSTSRGPISACFSLRVSLQSKMDSKEQLGSLIVQGEEIVISRKITFTNSKLLQYFIKRLTNSTVSLLYQDEAEVPYRMSHFNADGMRGRSTTSTAFASARFNTNVLKQGSPSGSPTSGSASTKSDRRDQITLKKVIETNSQQFARKGSFSMAVQIQQQKQMESNFLRRASKRVRQLQVFTTSIHLSDSSDESEGSEPEQKPPENFASFIGRRLPTIDEDLAKSSIFNKMSTIEEEQTTQVSPERPPLIDLKLTSSHSDSPEDAEKYLTKRTERLIRASSLNLDHKPSFKEQLEQVRDKCKDLFKLPNGKRFQLQRSRSWEEQEDDKVKLKMVAIGSVMAGVLLLVVFFLAVIKYEIDKL